MFSCIVTPRLIHWAAPSTHWFAVTALQPRAQWGFIPRPACRESAATDLFCYTGFPQELGFPHGGCPGCQTIALLRDYHKVDRGGCYWFCFIIICTSCQHGLGEAGVGGDTFQMTQMHCAGQLPASVISLWLPGKLGQEWENIHSSHLPKARLESSVEIRSLCVLCLMKQLLWLCLERCEE